MNATSTDSRMTFVEREARGRRRRAVVLAVAVVLQIVLLTIYYHPRPKGLVGDEVNYLELSAALERGERLIEPLRAPLYPYFLSALGATEDLRVPTQIVQIALFLVTAFCFGAVSKQLFDSQVVADLTTAMLLLYPTVAAFAHFFWPETLHLALWSGALAVLVSRRRSPAWLLTAGTLLALAALTRHLLLPFLPIVFLAVATEQRHRRWHRLAWLAAPIVLLVGTALWIDWRDDGRLRSASNAGFNLWIGLNDTSRRDLEAPIVYPEYLAYLASGETAAERDRLLRRRTEDLIAERGVLPTLAGQLGKQYFRLFDHGSFFTEQLPGGRVHDPQRGYAEQPASVVAALRLWNASFYALILLAAVWGVATAPVRKSRWLAVGLAFLAYNLGLFLALHVKSRYRLQILPFLVLFGAPAMSYWWSRLRGTAAPVALGRWRLLLTAAGGLLVLLLAFGAPLLG